MILTNADRLFAQNWVEQYRTNYYNDPDNVHETALPFIQSRDGIPNNIIGGAFYWSRTPEDEVWSCRNSHLFQSLEVLVR